MFHGYCIVVLCLAARSLIILGSSNGAAAYGIRSLNTLTAIGSVLNRVIVDDLAALNKHQRTAIAIDTIDIPTIASNSSQITDDGNLGDADAAAAAAADDDDDDEIHPKQAPTNKSSSVVSLSPASLRQLISDIESNLFLIQQW